MITLPATATFDEVPALAESLTASIGTGSEAVTVDAQALHAFDTSTIALVLQARRLAQAAGRRFELVGAPPKFVELARLYGVAELLSISPSPPAAAA